MLLKNFRLLSVILKQLLTQRVSYAKIIKQIDVSSGNIIEHKSEPNATKHDWSSSLVSVTGECILCCFVAAEDSSFSLQLITFRTIKTLFPACDMQFQPKYYFNNYSLDNKVGTNN